MNINNKLMKKVMLLAVVTIFVTASYGQSKNFIDQNYIEVEGFAEKKVTPNEIYLNIVINEKDFKNKTVKALEGVMIAQLKEAGIDVEKQLKMSDFTSNFKKYWLKKSDINQMREYVLCVSDAQTAGNVFLRLESVEISNVSILRIDHSDREQLKKEVKADAIKAAKEEATLLAGAIGQEVGRALYIDESRTPVYRYSDAMMVRAQKVNTGFEFDEESAAPNIEFEKIELQATVTVRFELK
jgi:uncharacterized protein